MRKRLPVGAFLFPSGPVFFARFFYIPTGNICTLFRATSILDSVPPTHTVEAFPGSGYYAPPCRRCLAGSPGSPGSGPGLSVGVPTTPVLLRPTGAAAMAEAALLLPPEAAAERDAREKLALWDRRPDTTAPLTDRQMDSVLELKAAAENLPIPFEVR